MHRRMQPSATLRRALAAPVLLVVITLSMALLATRVLGGMLYQWDEEDLLARARATASRASTARSTVELEALLAELARAEPLLAIAVCGSDGTLRAASGNVPADLTCDT